MKKSIYHNNELIAEFLGHELEETLSGKEVYAIVIHNNNTDFFYPNELQYDTDWNWLMKVVEKCLIGEAESPREIISPIYEGLCNVSLSETYNACVEFIKWYNK